MIKNNRNNEQIYGRNDMIMLDPNNKIYGSLGLADKYVMKTEEGTRLTLNNPKQGRFADVLTEFNIYGRSEQFSTTGVQLFNENIEIKNRGVTIKINGSTATFVGTVSDESNSRVNYQKKIKLKPGKYTASSSNEKIVADFAVKKANDEIIYNSHIEIDGTEEVKIRVLFGLRPSAKGDVINETTNIMLNDGDIALPYEPYTGGKPSPSPDYPQEIKSVVNPIVKVTNEDGLKVQSVTLNNITLNAIPVSSGGNVTIDGQQYIADYVDVEHEKLVRMVDTIHPKEALDMSRYAGIKENVTNYRIYAESADKTDKIGIFSNMLLRNSDIWSVDALGMFVIEFNAVDFTLSYEQLGISSSANFEQRDIAVKTWLENNDLMFMYVRRTPNEIDLTLEEVQAFKALVTYYPVTIIENNYNTWMKATYKSTESV